MKGYLGEEVVDIKNTPFANYTKLDWIEQYTLDYGWIDGSHHKTWVLDQIMRIIKNCEIEVKLAKWDNGTEEYRYNIVTESQDYLDFVKEYEDPNNTGEQEYEYDMGIAP